MLTIRPLNESDYDQYLSPWWIAFGFEPVPKDFLPENSTGGFIVFDDDIPIVSAFLYSTNSGIAWVDWVISNKEYRKKPERRIAIELLITTLTNTAREAGFKYCYSLMKNPQLVNIFEKMGYTKGVCYKEELIFKL